MKAGEEPDSPAAAPAIERIILAHCEPLRLGPLTIEPALRRIVHDDGREEILEQRVMQVLVALIRADGRILTRDDLVASCWQGRIVGDDAVNRVLSRLRRTADGLGRGIFRIETITKVGYRLTREIEPGATDADAGNTGQWRVGERARGPRPMRLALTIALAATLCIAIAAYGWQRWGGPRGDPQSVTLAVLPFADLSPRRDQSHLAEGLAEEILGALGRKDDLNVIGRTSSWQYRSAGLPAMRRHLGVTHVLEGSVRVAGKQLRTSVRLIRTSDSRQIWAEDFVRALDDVSNVQDDIGRAVAERLGARLPQSAIAGASAPVGIDAYSLYLAARARMRDRNRSELEQARLLARQAIAKDPAFGRAYALFAETTRHLARHEFSYGTIPIGEARSKALPFARRAIELEPDGADGYAALGAALYPEPAAIGPLQLAIRRDPARAEPRLWLGFTYNKLGRHDQALEQYRAAYALEPLWARAINRLALALAASGKSAEACVMLERWEEQGATAADLAWIKAGIAGERGDLSQMVLQARAALAADPKRAETSGIASPRFYLASAYNAMGLEAAAARASGPPQPLRTLLYGRERERLVTAARRPGPLLWDRLDGWAGIHGLAASRRWADLTLAYDARFESPTQLCSNDPALAIPVAAALTALGRRTEAATLLACLEAHIASERRNASRAPRRPEHMLLFERAQLAALRNDGEAATRLLDAAIAAGWRGSMISPDLSFYPAFDPLRRHPRFLAAERRLRAEIEKEAARLRSEPVPATCAGRS